MRAPEFCRRWLSKWAWPRPWLGHQGREWIETRADAIEPVASASGIWVGAHDACLESSRSRGGSGGCRVLAGAEQAAQHVAIGRDRCAVRPRVRAWRPAMPMSGSAPWRPERGLESAARDRPPCRGCARHGPSNRSGVRVAGRCVGRRENRRCALGALRATSCLPGPRTAGGVGRACAGLRPDRVGRREARIARAGSVWQFGMRSCGGDQGARVAALRRRLRAVLPPCRSAREGGRRTPCRRSHDKWRGRN